MNSIAETEAATHWSPIERTDLTPFQRVAAASAVESLSAASRTQVIMACGSGKTLVGATVFQALRGSLTLVLVPSLGLVRQTLSAWRAFGYLNSQHAVLCCCSDQTVADDDDGASAAELARLGVDVTTEVASIRAFIEQTGQRVVFCTYHSQPAIAEALPPGVAFDLGCWRRPKIDPPTAIVPIQI